jgi:hypothetical protein
MQSESAEISVSPHPHGVYGVPSRLVCLSASARKRIRRSVGTAYSFIQSSMSSAPNFFDRLHWHDPRDTFHDLFILLGLLQVVGCLQPHPYFR